jgi:predicted regulator of Ras-like GTPase activity (Roadblock/LC7/MglB family)
MRDVQEMSGFAISEEQSALLQTALTDLAVQSEARLAFLSDYGGNIVAQQSDADDGTIRTIAALGAGAFAATRELAALLGEKAFDSVQHRAAETGIYMHGVATHFLIAVVFSRETTAGLVKLYVEKTIDEIGPLLRQICDQSVSGVNTAGHVFELDAGADPFGRVVRA